MIKKIICCCLMFISCMCFANERPNNEMMRAFDRVPFFEFERHYINANIISYVMIEKHIYIFIRDQLNHTGGLIHSTKCPECAAKNND